MTHEPLWLRRDIVLAIHDAQLAEHGGIVGIRDAHLLDSALARPQQLFAYASTDIPTLAAAYAFGIARNHPFLDGNKRTAFVLALLFLHLNGWQFKAAPAESVMTMLRLAEGTIAEHDFAAWLSDKSKATKP